MSDQFQPKPIVDQIDDHVKAAIEPLGNDDKVVVGVTSDRDTVARVDGAVDLGKGFAAGGHVEKPRASGWNWFVAAIWRKKK